jgi:iron complex outermembrane receptor protein
VYPIVNENLTDGRAVGTGLMVTFAPTGNWRLVASHSFLDLNIDPHGQDINRGKFADGSTPRHQLGLRSSIDLGGVQVDVFLRHIGEIRRDPQIVSGEGIPAYTELDLRMAYPWSQFEFAVALQNLLHDHHLEFGSPAYRGEIERSVHASVVWRR